MTNATGIQALSGQWQTLCQQEPKLRIRDAALRLGVSEGELLTTRIGQNPSVGRASGRGFQTLVTRH